MRGVTPLHDRAAKALDYAQEWVKQMLALSTGVVALTLTFFKDFAGAASAAARDVIFVSWILFFISILFGILTLLSMTSNIWPGNRLSGLTQHPIFGPLIYEIFAALQIVFFTAAFITMVVARSLALGSHAATSPTPMPAQPSAGAIAPHPAKVRSSPAGIPHSWRWPRCWPGSPGLRLVRPGADTGGTARVAGWSGARLGR